jgi:hypothetical protein
MQMKSTFAAALLAMLLAGCANMGSQTPPKMTMTTEIPPQITTPDSVDTRLGTLKFFDGFPDDATVDKVYDNLDFERGVQAFLTGLPGTSLVGMRTGMHSVGANNSTVIIFEQLMDSKALWLTPNTDSIYFGTWLDLHDGPLVIESPPKILGFLDDFWFHYIIDIGNAGPDKGQGGKFLVLPPGYKGDVPEGYFVARSRTYGVWFVARGFKVNGDPGPAVASIKKTMRIYPLAQAGSPPETKFINVSGIPHNTIHANNFEFYEELNQIVQEEPTDSLDPESLGLFASVGIEKGKPFAPDERMKKILTEAAAVGNATARAIVFKSRIKEAYFYPNSAWCTPFVGGSYLFESQPGVRNLDTRTMMFYYATGVTPAMAAKIVGIGSQYAAAFVDSQGNALDGSKTYKLHLPPNIPAKDFWSITLYDNQTRSELQTDQQFPAVSSLKAGVVTNSDTSADVYFGPTAPAGHEGNWVQTIPGKGWNVLLRLYGPGQSWFDKTWQPGEIELVK